MEGYLGEIRMFAGNYAPQNWMFCYGQTLTVQEYTALFSILGAIYGGDGRTNFALPDLRGRAPVNWTAGSSASGIIPTAQLGKPGGSIQNNITVPLPPHTHQASFTGTGGTPATPNTLGVAVQIAVANSNTSNVANPQGNILAIPKPSGVGSINAYAPVASATAGAYLGGVTGQITGSPGSSGSGITGGTVTVLPAGTGSIAQATVVPPYLGMNFIICISGMYPPRSS